MDRQEPKLPTEHSMNRRAFFHDYTQPGVYMLTLTVADRYPWFGELAPDEPPRILYSPLGKAILEREMHKMPAYYPNVEIWVFMLMPDHIHMILRVKNVFAEGRSLGSVIRGFKTGCTRAWWASRGWTPCNQGGDRDGGTDKLPVLFSPGYNDRILQNAGQLQRWKAYLEDNPRRLYLKRRYPNLFKVIQQYIICGSSCSAVGNMFLLQIPDKMAVVVHRRDSDAYYSRKAAEWMDCGARGGVLVGAFIAPRERAIKEEAMKRGYRIIELMDNGFPRLYKPAGVAFDACAKGLLLQISQWPYHYENRHVTRAKCLQMNSLAEAIASS